MKHHTVLKIRLAFLVICGCIIAMVMGFDTQEPESVQAYRKFGSIEKARLESYQLDTKRDGDNTIAIQGNDFNISKEHIDCYVEELVSLHGYDKKSAIEKALTATIEKYAQFYKACAEGYLISDEALDQVIQTNINMMKQSSTQDDNIDAFLTAIDMTVEEYWESMRDTLKITETIGHYKQAILREFSEKESKKSNIDRTDFDKKWGKITDDAIASQDITVIYP